MASLEQSIREIDAIVASQGESAPGTSGMRLLPRPSRLAPIITTMSLLYRCLRNPLIADEPKVILDLKRDPGQETSMQCPTCNADLIETKRDGIDLKYCQSCKGMWLTRQELEQLEDKVFDFDDDKKGSLIFSSAATTRNCPQCGKPMRTFQYRLYDLQLDFCVDAHGYWLDADEDKRVLELMKKEEAGLKRKVLAEDKWASHLKSLRSGSFLDKVRDLFR
jgi:Zn-finger nucleic acid-binding protein